MDDSRELPWRGPSYKEAWMRLGRPGGVIPGVHGFLLSNR
jgi:hypothetical protein